MEGGLGDRKVIEIELSHVIHRTCNVRQLQVKFGLVGLPLAESNRGNLMLIDVAALVVDGELQRLNSIVTERSGGLV